MSESEDRARRAERREGILLALGCTMCGVWVVGVLVQVAFPTHPLPSAVHGVILALVPLLFGTAFLTARKHSNGGSSES